MKEDLGQELLEAGFNGIDIDKLNKESILQEEIFLKIFSTSNNVERTKLIVLLQEKARKLGVIRSFDKLLKAYQQEFVQNAKRQGGNVVGVTNPPLEDLKCGEWQVDDFGVYKYKQINFEQVKLNACSHPIIPIERLVNIDSNTEKIKLAFLKDAKWQSIVVDRSTVANKGSIVQLADRGIEVTSENAKELVNYISDMVSLNMNIIPCNKSIGRLGWTEDGFSPYIENVKYDGDQAYQDLYDCVRSKGNYTDWKNLCLELRQKSKIAHLLLASSFSAPLLKILGLNCFIVHLWGGTGTGKTVGLMLAMSIWGNPDMGKLVRTLNSTQVALARLSSFCNNIPIAGDELQILKSRWDSFDNLIMYLCEGIDRGRGKAYGGIEEQSTWNTVFLFTGEEPITKSNSGGGTKNRVIEVETTEKVIEDGNSVSNFLRENYGLSGKEFIDKLPDKKALQERYNTIFKEIMNKCDTTDKQAMAMAVILLADEISTNQIFKDNNSLKIEDIKEYMHSSKEVDVVERAYEWTLNWIDINKNRFTNQDIGEIWGKLYEDENYCLINKSIYDEQLSKAGFDFRAIIKKFSEKGYILRNSQGKFIHQTHAFGNKGNYIKLCFGVNKELIDIKQDEIPF